VVVRYLREMLAAFKRRGTGRKRRKEKKSGLGAEEDVRGLWVIWLARDMPFQQS